MRRRVQTAQLRWRSSDGAVHIGQGILNAPDAATFQETVCQGVHLFNFPVNNLFSAASHQGMPSIHPSIGHCFKIKESNSNLSASPETLCWHSAGPARVWCIPNMGGQFCPLLIRTQWLAASCPPNVTTQTPKSSSRRVTRRRQTG